MCVYISSVDRVAWKETLADLFITCIAPGARRSESNDSHIFGDASSSMCFVCINARIASACLLTMLLVKLHADAMHVLMQTQLLDDLSFAPGGFRV